MVSDAERYAAEDKARKDAIDARNDADALIYSAEKSAAEYKEQLPAAIGDEIAAAIGELRAAMEGDDAAAIRAKGQALQAATMKIGEHLAGKGGAGGAGGAAGGEDKENVQDAEVKEKP
jgi:molecular chaperone DnaK